MVSERSQMCKNDILLQNNNKTYFIFNLLFIYSFLAFETSKYSTEPMLETWSHYKQLKL